MKLRTASARLFSAVMATEALPRSLTRIDGLGESSSIGHGKGADPARCAFQRMRDFLPRLLVAGVKNGLQAVDHFAGLRVEKPQNFSIDRFVTACVTGEVAKIDGTAHYGHARLPEMAQEG